MAFNLPPPWNPGFALPENVRDEGLQRRAFVTRQAPRGTYDDPKVGSGGFVLPKYVKKEGYGQGAFVTQWSPRGTYDLPVPHRLDQRSPVPVLIKEGNQEVIGATNLGGTKLPAVYDQFGQKAAAAMIAPVLMAEPSERKNILKRIMDSIDPTLWTRTATLAQQYAKAGHDAMSALQAGLARALSTGAAREVVDAGKTGQIPTSGLMGLGCACAQQSLGALPPSASALLSNFKNIATAVLEPPPKLQVGPFLLDLTPGSIATFPWNKMTGEQSQAVIKGVAMASVKSMMANFNRTPGYPPGWVTLGSIFPNGGSSRCAPDILKKPTLTFHFKHPTDGKRYGVYVKVVNPGADPQVEVSFKYDPTFLQSVWNGIMELAAAIVKVVKAVIDVVGGLACQLAQSPNAAQAGAAIGVAAGAGASTGAAGAEIVKGACYTPPPAAPPPPVAPSSSPLLPLAIAGGAVAAVYFATRKK